MDVVGSNHNIDVARSLRDLLAVFLRQATADNNFHVRARFFEGLKPTKMAIELVVGILTNTAGIEHHNIGRFIGIGEHQAVGFEQARDAFRIVLVHLTPIGADGIAAGLISHRHRLPVGAKSPEGQRRLGTLWCNCTGLLHGMTGTVRPAENQSSSEIGTSCSAVISSPISRSSPSAPSPIPTLVRMRSVISTMTSGFSSR
ncbi:unannotated protein [freshwater metagenome]|uniref:Unannotated protein n=1 Tax=freshwater metagenome TaxID=449393 RepID=A0A6J6GR27_9ZZZZ